jgi:hypothetical protein
MTLSDAPKRLREAVRHYALGQGLSAIFSPAGVKLIGGGFSLLIGRGAVGRGTQESAISDHLVRGDRVDTYGEDSLSESFRSLPDGLEQSFRLLRRPVGVGPVLVDVEVSGLVAADDGDGIDLHERRGTIVATYSRLHVTDAHGRVIPASMHATANGKTIVIVLQDRTATYPITVDPIWSPTQEFTEPTPAAADYFGYSVAISGDTAMVGSYLTTVGDNVWQGAVYVFSLSDGSWTETQQLLAGDGEAYDEFGQAVALSGSTALIGSSHSSGGNTGTVYAFGWDGSEWLQGQEFRPTGLDFDLNAFGSPIAISGNTAVIGDPEQDLDDDGAVGAAFVYTSSGLLDRAADAD